MLLSARILRFSVEKWDGGVIWDFLTYIFMHLDKSLYNSGLKKNLVVEKWEGPTT